GEKASGATCARRQRRSPSSQSCAIPSIGWPRKTTGWCITRGARTAPGLQRSTSIGQGRPLQRDQKTQTERQQRDLPQRRQVARRIFQASRGRIGNGRL